MRAACTACGTKYEIRDERVLGRVVKMRCKRCGEVVVVDGSEASVLFSLAMLTRTDPEPPAAPAPIDDLVNLSAGGAFAPALAPPVVAASFEPERKADWRVVLAVAVGVLVAVTLPAAVYAARARPPASARTTPTATVPARATATATATEAKTETATETETGTATATATGTATATETGTGTGTATATARPRTLRPTPTVSPPPGRTPCCPGESPAACEMRRSVGVACAPVAPFDAAAARHALASVDLASCKRPGGPRGSGHVRVTFDASGAVTSATADTPPYAETSAGRCVADRYRAVRVPAFTGESITVGKSFSVE